MKNDSFLIRAIDFLFNKKRAVDIHAVEQEKMPEKREKESQATQTQSCVSTTSQSNFLKPDAEKERLFTSANVMRALGVEILEDGGDGYFLVGFQGGVFVLSFEDDRLNVMYNDVMECHFDDIIKASLVANEINSTYAVWSCYLRTASRGTSGLPVKVCFSQMFPLNGDFKETTELIHGVMSSAFSIGREFRERFKKAQQDHTNLSNTLTQKDFVYKLELAKRLMEVQNYDEIKDEMPPTSYLRIESLADIFNDTEFGQVQSMKLITDDDLKMYDQPEEILNFDLRSFVRNHEKREELQFITLIVAFEKQDLIISLKKLPGSSRNSLFFALNIMRSGVDDDYVTHDRSLVSCRDTIEIRLTTNQEDYWEVKYMVDEARDKHNTEDVSSLTDEQKMMLIQLSPNLQDDLYWGLKFFNQDCLYQSLFYLKRIYYNFCHPGNRGPKHENTLSDVCLYIGIAYCQLKRYELAYYFLDKTHKYDSILAAEWYTNCLCSLKDPGAYRYIKRMLSSVAHNLEDSEMDANLQKDLYNFYLFLKRRLLQTLLTDLRLTEAETFATQMIQRKENVDFCKKELEAIRRLRHTEEELRRSKDAQAQNENLTENLIDDDDEDSQNTDVDDTDDEDTPEI